MTNCCCTGCRWPGAGVGCPRDVLRDCAPPRAAVRHMPGRTLPGGTVRGVEAESGCCSSIQPALPPARLGRPVTGSPCCAGLVCRYLAATCTQTHSAAFNRQGCAPAATPCQRMRSSGHPPVGSSPWPRWGLQRQETLSTAAAARHQESVGYPTHMPACTCCCRRQLLLGSIPVMLHHPSTGSRTTAAVCVTVDHGVGVMELILDIKATLSCTVVGKRVGEDWGRATTAAGCRPADGQENCKIRMMLGMLAVHGRNV